MARGRARRADPEGPRHFLDPAADLGQAHLCRAWPASASRSPTPKRRTANRSRAFPSPRRAVPPSPGDRVRAGGVACARRVCASRSPSLAAAWPWQRSRDLASPRPAIRRCCAQRGSPAPIPVDVELVLAVDVSYSMDPEEQALQREGYMAALTSREFLQALKQGMHGKIAHDLFRMGRHRTISRSSCRGG